MQFNFGFYPKRRMQRPYLTSECFESDECYRKLYHSLGYHTWDEMHGKDVHHICFNNWCRNKNHLTLLNKEDHFVGVHKRGLLKSDPTGTTASPKTRKKMSESHSGENNAFFGRKHTAKTKRRMSKAKKGKTPHNKGKSQPQTQGEKNPKAKLTQQQADAIRKEYAQGGTSHRQLADKYGVSKPTITRILNNKTYI